MWRAQAPCCSLGKCLPAGVRGSQEDRDKAEGDVMAQIHPERAEGEGPAFVFFLSFHKSPGRRPQALLCPCVVRPHSTSIELLSFPPKCLQVLCILSLLLFFACSPLTTSLPLVEVNFCHWHLTTQGFELGVHCLEESHATVPSQQMLSVKSRFTS